MMKPLNRYVLVKLNEEQEQSAMKGLIIPKGTDTDPTNLLRCGVVENVSKYIEENEKDIVIGSTVFYNKHAITKIPNEENLILVRLEDLYIVK